jgi:hypothetical protein
MSTFRYKYLVYPFGELQYFSVQAGNRTAADELARERFIELFNNRQTVMTEFWPA